MLDYILEAARLAPSSSGFQQYKIIVISDKALEEKIRSISYDQSQITDCSHLLVLAAWDGYSDQRVTKVFNHMMEQRELPLDTMDAYKESILNLFEPLGQE